MNQATWLQNFNFLPLFHSQKGRLEKEESSPLGIAENVLRQILLRITFHCLYTNAVLVDLLFPDLTSSFFLSVVLLGSSTGILREQIKMRTENSENKIVLLVIEAYFPPDF